jgi:hypothetical protein
MIGVGQATSTRLRDKVLGASVSNRAQLHEFKRVLLSSGASSRPWMGKSKASTRANACSPNLAKVGMLADRVVENVRSVASSQTKR